MDNKKYIINNTEIHYVSAKNNTTALLIYPVGEFSELDGLNINADSMIQVKFECDSDFIEFSEGVSMRNSFSVNDLSMYDQNFEEDGIVATITTYLKDKRGNEYIHHLKFFKQCDAMEIYCEYINKSGKEQKLELFTSFSLSGIRMSQKECTTYGLKMHRFTSFWSIEGRHQITEIENLGLEESWGQQGVRCERFGQRGSFPVREYFPFVAIEDDNSNNVWAVSLQAPYSWQIEAYTIHKSLSLSGGLADYEFGHWKKAIKNDESFLTHSAYITVVKGDIEKACGNLVNLQRAKRERIPQSENNMPVIFNEYCATWGNPSQENVFNLVDTCSNYDIDYFIVDAGWYRKEGINWCYSIGDWEASPQLFPDGINNVSNYIHKKGMKAGIWFEMENCGVDSDIYKKTDWLLHRNGYVLNSKYRRFFDLRKREVEDYIGEKVFKFIKNNEFDYIKVDYNENIGIGCDGAESFGEGGRQVLEKSLSLFDKLNDMGMIVENCASGGHRLEPLRMSKVSMASFSDAHEGKEIPIIAGNVARLIPSEQNQIWAVVRENDDDDRLIYSINATLYGRLCLSGNIDKMNSHQSQIIKDGIAFYKRCAKTIQTGNIKLLQNDAKYYLKPEGCQYGIIENDKNGILVVHFFNNPSKFSFELDKNCNILDKYTSNDVVLKGQFIKVDNPRPFSSLAVFYEK